MSKDCRINFETALEILNNPVFNNRIEFEGAIKFVSEAFNMSEDAILEEIEKEFPFSVCVKIVDNDAQATEQIIKRCKTKEDAKNFVEKHEQDFANAIDICAVYIDGEDNEKNDKSSDEQGFILCKYNRCLCCLYRWRKSQKSDDNSSEEKLTEEEQGFIDVVELALDWSLPVPDEDYKKYEELIKRRAALNKN